MTPGKSLNILDTPQYLSIATGLRPVEGEKLLKDMRRGIIEMEVYNTYRVSLEGQYPPRYEYITVRSHRDITHPARTIGNDLALRLGYTSTFGSVKTGKPPERFT